MIYAKIENNVAVEVGTLRQLFPFAGILEADIPSFIESFNTVELHQFREFNDRTQFLENVEPYQDGDKWYNVKVTDKSEAQLAEELEAQWLDIRKQRTARLANCDWTQLPDVTVDKAAWQAYRTQLRDIPLQADPYNITWPEEP